MAYPPFGKDPLGGMKKTAGAPDWGAGAGTGSEEAAAEGLAAYKGGQRGADPNKVPGYGDMSKWKGWYGAQQGGGRPEDMARFSPETLAGWDQWLQKSGPQAGKYRSMRGAEGWFDKPTECPPGMSPSGPNEDDPCVPNGSGGTGTGGGPGGGGPGGGGGMDQGDLIMYRLKKLYGEALDDPTGQKAWQLYAGQGGAKSFQDTIDQMRNQIAGMPAGPGRQAAEQRLMEMETNMKLQLPQAATQNALQGITGVMDPELGYVKSERDRALEKQLGNRGMDIQYELGLGNLALGGRAEDRLGQGQYWEQNTRFPWEQSEADKNREMQKYLAKQSKPGFWGTLGGIAGSALQGIGSSMFKASDARVKESIGPGRRGLSDLKKLRQYSFRYKGMPEFHQGVMAQDLEKVAPELVREFDGIKAVDTYGLLSMTMNAVKELDEKLGER
jgi:hypothetical protein